MLTFYDIEAPLPGRSWSPNTRKTKYSLEYKGLPYETAWKFPHQLEQTCKDMKAPPTGVRRSGKPRYTFPIMHDSSTNTTVSESFLIAQYLDEKYPETPRLIPEGTVGLQYAFITTVEQSVLRRFGDIVALQVYKVMKPGSKAAEIFRRATEYNMGTTFDKVAPKNAEEEAKVWEEVESGFTWIEKCILQNGAGAKYVMGSKPCFADFAVAGRLYTIRTVFGENSKEWRSACGWNGGRWGRYLNDMESIGTPSSKL